MMSASDAALRELVSAIVAEDAASWRAALAATPELARAAFASGATRNNEEGWFLDEIRLWIYAGDTALHFAAAAFRVDAVRDLLSAGADVQARNRHGHTPLHSAASGRTGLDAMSRQAATIAALIEAGADPNSTDKRGVTPLHVAVRCRSAEAVRVLLEHGADASRKNGNGSTPMLLATRNTGRGGSGTPEAKARQAEIVRLLEDRMGAVRAAS